ncbi:hypothetical protein Q669_29535 [Labrenzia sp. C1B10]|uniref:DNA-methyltransferase n=1 Tax=unclassified Labrenzia TaxID=2648686 RepID=UPI0003B91919|nr:MULTISPECIES: site-specific DNA-methyltransferase [unclassified Labrenzia]ERP95713.1 hypothetical protein Q669_29535 [Labrenzia sp. C1B10]ERS05779.1 hypothetical protein Q675_29100 [Labrenzia sp. C1B70]
MTDITIIEDDALAALRRLNDDGVLVDGCLTDPPYYLESIVKRFGRKQAAAKQGQDGRFTRLSDGFRGRQWDTDQNGYKIAHDPEFWRLVKQLIRPGGFCFAFSSPKTGHRQAVAMEDAGFIMHPLIGWLYGTGWPKAHSVTKFVPEATKWSGWYYGTQTQKPALEPIYIGQVPFEGTGYGNVLTHGVGAFNIDECRIGDSGRWPANVMHDGSEPVVSLVGQAVSEYFGMFPPALYSQKATKEDRAGSNHPSVKPVSLLRTLIRLIMPKGSTVIDPFAGSGTTGAAARAEGMNAILIEREEDYADIIRGRFDENLKSPLVEIIYRLLLQDDPAKLT